MTDKNQRHPAVVIAYGPPKRGKTTDCGYSFPNGLFIAQPGALNPVHHLCGYAPAEVMASTIEDATAILKKYASNSQYDAVIVDDFSYLAENTTAAIKKKYRNGGWQMWDEITEATLAFRNTARNVGLHVILNCWEKLPKNGALGGPMLVGQLSDKVPALCDLVLRCSVEPMRKPWVGVYTCDPTSPYITGDRFNVCTRLGTAPMNLAEILREAGYDMSRHKEIPWQEEFVESAASKILEGNGAQDAAIANQLYSSLLDKGVDYRIATWTLRDALDRAIIRRGLQASQHQFIA